MAVLKTLIFTVLVPGTVTVLVWRRHPGSSRSTKSACSQGAISVCEKPDVVGVSLLLFSEALVFESAVLFVYAAMVPLAFQLFVPYYEEPTLRDKCGSHTSDIAGVYPAGFQACSG